MELQEEMAYLKYFGLEVNPFPVAPDVEHFFLSRDIDRLITEIVHGIVTRKGFMALTGEVGLGKTTISRKIMKILEEKGVQTSLVFHTSYQDVELLRAINRDFGLLVDTLEFGDLMNVLQDFLLGQNMEGRNCAIIIDDAQNLSPESLELVRMISNLETDRQKLVQVLLIGQPELMEKLDSPELRQLKSRIIIKQEARPLPPEEPAAGQYGHGPHPVCCLHQEHQEDYHGRGKRCAKGFETRENVEKSSHIQTVAFLVRGSCNLCTHGNPAIHFPVSGFPPCQRDQHSLLFRTGCHGEPGGHPNKCGSGSEKQNKRWIGNAEREREWPGIPARETRSRGAPGVSIRLFAYQVYRPLCKCPGKRRFQGNQKGNTPRDRVSTGDPKKAAGGSSRKMRCACMAEYQGNRP